MGSFFRWLGGWWRRVRGRPPVANVVVIGPEQGRQRQEGWHAVPPPGPTAAAHILQALFTPRQSSEHQVQYRQVPPQGMVVQKREEWRRGRDGMEVVHQQTLVVTCSGQVVPAESIQSVCADCGGYEAALFRCNHPACGVALCRRHARFFDGPNGQVTLCDRHYREALAAVRTWDLARSKLERRAANGRPR